MIVPRRIRVAVLVLLFLVLFVFLFDPWPVIVDVVNSARIRWELPRAVERWQAHDIDEYRIAVKGMVPLACAIDGELSIENGQLMEVRMRETPLVPETPLLLLDRSDWQHGGCSLEELTIERMFDRVAHDLTGVGLLGAPLTVEFDDDWGFITKYRFGRPSRGGLFGYAISECCVWFEFDGFVPLPEPSPGP